MSDAAVYCALLAVALFIMYIIQHWPENCVDGALIRQKSFDMVKTTNIS
jgi:hypothetical protein